MYWIIDQSENLKVKENSEIIITSKGTVALSRIFLLFDLREFIFRFRVAGPGKMQKKALKMTSSSS